MQQKQASHHRKLNNQITKPQNPKPTNHKQYTIKQHQTTSKQQQTTAKQQTKTKQVHNKQETTNKRTKATK